MMTNRPLRTAARRRSLATIVLATALLVPQACSGGDSVAASTKTQPAPSHASFVDGRDDAYRLPGVPGRPPENQVPNPILSDSTADILQIDYDTVSWRSGKHVYRVTMRIAGTADPTYNYWAAGVFGTGGCYVFHYLPTGGDAEANIFCDDSARYIGSLPAGEVVTTTDQAGTTLSAEFTYAARKAPHELRSDQTLGPLLGYTCVQGVKGAGCDQSEWLDNAQDSAATFTL